MKKIVFIIFMLLIITAVLLGGLQLVLTNQFATSGADVEALLIEERDLRAEHEHLQAKAQDLRSLSRIATRSTELGFLPIETHIVLGGNPSLAYGQ